MIKNARIILLIIFFALGKVFTKQSKVIAQVLPVAKMEEFHQRGGLPNLFNKIKTGKEVRIAYLGGSITAAPDGWRDLTFSWFRSNYPQTPFIQIDATIGGTGSDLGVFRMDRDVVKQNPDLIFVEFAVNDSGASAESIYRTMEGIVRKAWKANPTADICFVYTLADNVVETMRKGTYQNSAIAMEKIAEYYHIPSIHMGVEVIRLLEAGKLIFTGDPEANPDKIVFTKDHTHPLSLTGHPIYAHVVINYLKKMESYVPQMPHVISRPFIKDNWENARMVPLSEVKLNDKWITLPAKDELQQRFGKFMPVLNKAIVPGASFTIKFKGNTLGVYDVIGPKTGIVDVVIDGKKPIEINRFDRYCNSYRKNTFFLNGLSDGEHEVAFSVTGREFDKAKILSEKNITITRPEDYAENGWIVGDILLIGDVLK